MQPTPWIEQIRRQLAGVSETAGLDAQVLLSHVLGKRRSWALAHPEAALTRQQVDELNEKLDRLAQGEPLPYVLGEWEFYGLNLHLTPAVLIPRPETEMLVEQALEWLQANPERRRAADVGAGSGCIAIALAQRICDLHLLASDLSADALQVASQNARRYKLDRRIHFVQADLLPGVRRPFDLICANLPYIPTGTLQTLTVARWEPSLALDGGPDGLRLIERLLDQIPARLAPGGLILLEIEAGQGQAVETLLRARFPTSEIGILPDLAGRDRLARIQF